MFTFSNRWGLPFKHCESQELCFDIAVEPDNRGVAQTTDTIFKYYVYLLKYRSGISSLSILDETALTNHHVFGFKPFSPLFQAFNKTIGRLIDVGYFTKFFEWIYRSSKNEDIGPQVLTMDHLGLCFIACLIPLGIAFVIFLIEVIVSSCKKLYHQN